MDDTYTPPARPLWPPTPKVWVPTALGILAALLHAWVTGHLDKAEVEAIVLAGAYGFFGYMTPDNKPIISYFTKDDPVVEGTGEQVTDRRKERTEPPVVD